MLGKLGADGRGAPGLTKLGLAIRGAFAASPMPAGRGCLGPDKICPGLGAGGTGLPAIADPLAGLGEEGLGAAGLGAPGAGAGA